MISDHKDDFFGMPVVDFDYEIDEEGDGEDDEGDDDEEGGAGGFRRFEFSDDKSNKFWEIKLEGESFTVRFGRIGTAGQEQTKDFDDDEKARKEYDKLIKEKTGKGYEEVGGNGDDDEGGDDAENFDPNFDPEKTIYRIGCTYDEAESGDDVWVRKFKAYLKQPGASKTVGLSVGAWGSVGEGDDSASVIEALVNASSKLPNLKYLFLGDIVSEESEISWINQTDVSPLLIAFSNLEHFGVRGGEGLSLGTMNHAKLRSLVLEAGGLPNSVISEVINSKLPNLEHLEFWFGSGNYGGDVTVEDLRPLLFDDRFPKLKYLGLRNAEIADGIAQELKGAPIMNRIAVLDMSMGTLTDQGGQALLDNPAITRLKKLDLHYHFMSNEMMEQFKALGIDVDLEDKQDYDPNDEWSRYCAVSE